MKHINLSYQNILFHICGCDGIGRHARFRFLCREVYGFESLHPHHIEKVLENISVQGLSFEHGDGSFVHLALTGFRGYHNNRQSCKAGYLARC